MKIFGHTKICRNPMHPYTITKILDMRILTGSVKQIVEWFEKIQGVPMFEVTGYFIGIGMAHPERSLYPGNDLNLLLRDCKNSGPILQVIQPSHQLPEMPCEIEMGRLLRCVGKVVDTRKMLAAKISVVPANEQDDYNRLRYVCRSAP